MYCLLFCEILKVLILYFLWVRMRGFLFNENVWCTECIFKVHLLVQSSRPYWFLLSSLITPLDLLWRNLCLPLIEYLPLILLVPFFLPHIYHSQKSNVQQILKLYTHHTTLTYLGLILLDDYSALNVHIEFDWALKNLTYASHHDKPFYLLYQIFIVIFLPSVNFQTLISISLLSVAWSLL